MSAWRLVQCEAALRDGPAPALITDFPAAGGRQRNRAFVHLGLGA
jgi:hypothetical protein